MPKNRFKPWQRITAACTAFFFLLQTTLAVAAPALNGIQITDYLDSRLEFQRSNSGPYQYTAITEAVDQAASDLYSIEDFHSELNATYSEALGAPIFVPIAVGSITTIIPVFKKWPAVGTEFVQSRYVRSQVRALLGKHLINSDDPSYASESAQLDTLYQNALVFARDYNKNYGEPLNYDIDASPVPNMIWPERRVIHGQEVLVPIVYLTAYTISTQKVDDFEIRFNGETTFGNISVEGVDIHLGRDAFLRAVDSLTLVEGAVAGEGDINIVAGGTFSLLSSVVDAAGDVNIGAYTLDGQTLIHRYDFGRNKGYRYGTITSIDAQGGNVNVRTYADLSLQGVDVASAGSINFVSDGNIYLGAVEGQEQQSLSDGWRGLESSVDYLQTSLTAEESISLLANGAIHIDAAELVAEEGHIEILAGLGITIEDELTQYSRNMSGKFGKRSVTESVYQTVAIRSLLDAGKKIRLETEFGDITLKAVNISSNGGTTVSARNGMVNLLMTTETDHYAYSKVRKGTFTTKTENRGHEIETGVPNTIVGGFAVEAHNGLNVEYEGKKGLECTSFLTEIGEPAGINEDPCLKANVLSMAAMPGLEWMAEIYLQAEADPDAYNWDEIVLQHKTWSESNRSLSPAFAAVIAIAVAVAAGPAAGSAVAGGVGAASAGAVGAAISAGTTTLLTQTTLALVNGALNDDIGGAMEALASEETVKSLAVSMVTAGAIAQLDVAIFGLDSEGISSAADAAAQLPNATVGSIQAAVDQAMANAIAQSTSSLLAQSGQAVIHATVRAGVNTVIDGGNFSDSFINSLAAHAVNSLGQELAEEIGDASKPDPLIPGSEPDINQITRYIAHAASGCLTGSLTAGYSQDDVEAGCAAGAGGAVVGEAIGDLYVYAKQDEVDALESLLESEVEFIQELQEAGMDTPKELLAELELDAAYYSARVSELQSIGVDVARLGSALGAFLAGADAHNIYIAADSGANAAEHNALPALIWGGTLLLSAIGTYLTAEALYENGKKLLSDDTTDAEKNEILRQMAIDLGIEVVLIGTGVTAVVALGKMINKARGNGFGDETLTKLEEFWKSKYDADNEAGYQSYTSIDEIKFRSPLDTKLGDSLEDHMITPKIKGKQVSGGHNEVEFSRLVDDGKIEVVGEPEQLGNGIKVITYRVLGKADAKVLPTKTVYDPSVISDTQIMDLGKAAISKNYDEAFKTFESSGMNKFTSSSGGINFQYYLGISKETGETIVSSVHPIK